MLKRLIRSIGRKRTGAMCLLAIGLFFGALLEMLGISLVVSVCSLLVDEGRMAQSGLVQWLCGALGVQPGKQFMIVLLTVLMAVYVFKLAYLLGENYVMVRFVRKFRLDISVELYDGVLRGPYDRITRAGASKIMSTINTEVIYAANYLESSLQVVAEVLVAAALSVLLAVINPLMTGFVVAGMGISLLITQVLIRNKAARLGKVRQQENAQRIKWLNQGVQGIKEIKAGQTEGFFSAQYQQANQRHMRADARNQLLRSMPRLCIEAVMVISVLAYVLVLVATDGDVIAFLPGLSALVLAAIRLLPSCSRINSALTEIGYSKAAVAAVMDALEQVRAERAARESAGPGKTVALAESVAAKGITFYYEGRPEPVLQNADILIPAGSSVGIMGASGAGKTTLVDILLGLLRPQEGAVYVDGIDLEQCRASYLEKVAYIPQVIFLLDGTVRENVALGQPPEQVSDEAVWEALEKAALAGMVRALPQGLDTQVGEGGIRLSGGERQRIGIARALYRGSTFMVFDEATSALDTDTEEQIIRSIQQLRGERTVVIISHRPSAVRNCDRLYRVEGERVFQVPRDARPD